MPRIRTHKFRVQEIFRILTNNVIYFPNHWYPSINSDPFGLLPKCWRSCDSPCFIEILNVNNLREYCSFAGRAKYICKRDSEWPVQLLGIRNRVFFFSIPLWRFVVAFIQQVRFRFSVDEFLGCFFPGLSPHNILLSCHILTYLVSLTYDTFILGQKEHPLHRSSLSHTLCWRRLML